MSGFKPLPRRTFLKGLGAAMALPYLEGMAPARAAGASVTPPVRGAFVFFPNGAIQPAWKPEQAGADYKMSETLKPLEAFRAAGLLNLGEGSIVLTRDGLLQVDRLLPAFFLPKHSPALAA